MKHIFIVNPVSGDKKAPEKIYGSLSSFPSDTDIKIYITKGKSDAERYIRQYLFDHSDSVRFYACGGDGTLHEVINGAAPFPQASVAVYPCGSGNDFAKCLGFAVNMLDLPALVKGVELPVDLMKVNDRFCINICHFGFDSYVAQKMNEVRSKKLLGGSNAYTTGVVLGLVHAMKNRAVIRADGENMSGGEFLLCTVANGRYVGGQYKCAPKAILNDGLLDICVADPVSRLTFLRLVKQYAEGSHLTDPRFKRFLRYKQCKHVEIIAEDGFCISLDGEVYPMPKAEIDLIHNGIRITVPEKALNSAEAAIIR